MREGGREGSEGSEGGRRDGGAGRVHLKEVANRSFFCLFALIALFDSFYHSVLSSTLSNQPSLPPSTLPSLPSLRRNPFMDIRPDEKGAQFFIRQKTKEAQGVIDQTYKKGKAERDLIVERMNARRAARMAGECYNSDSASAGGASCAIS